MNEKKILKRATINKHSVGIRSLLWVPAAVRCRLLFVGQHTKRDVYVARVLCDICW